MTGATEKFAWPSGKRAALSVTWDDGRPTQAATAVPILDRHGLRATFYVLPRRVRDNLAMWRAVAASGHEIGNHSLSHPCSGNFPFTRHNALEDRTLAEMEAELVGANREIVELLGVTPSTYAYCCGQTFVGRGRDVKSYVPLVAEHFAVGRRAFDETCNDPAFCDLAQVFGVDMDERSFDALLPKLLETLECGGWLILVGHDVAVSGRQTTQIDTLERLCAFATDETNGLWIDTVAAVGGYVAAHQRLP